MSCSDINCHYVPKRSCCGAYNTNEHDQILTAGTRSFLTSSTALLILISALACVSSTVIRTWRSSFRCSQFGFPLFCSSWKGRERVRQMVRECNNVGVLYYTRFNISHKTKGSLRKRPRGLYEEEVSGEGMTGITL